MIDPAVQGSVDVALRDVPWDQALDIILRANKLGYSMDGTIVRVAPLTVLADEEKQRRQLAEQQALAGELQVMTATLSYATAEQVRPLLLKSALTQRGTVEFDARSNTLIISDLQAALDRASALIATLDRAQPQVEIEARIVITNKSYRREIGAQLGLGGEMSPRLGNTTPLVFPNSIIGGGRTGATSPTPGAPNGVNLGVPGATSALGLALGAVNGAFNLDVALTALENEGKLSVISTPRVSTQNNVEAEIAQGTQIPIQTVANNTVTVTFKDAALVLRVTPQITAANTVIMKIALENAAGRLRPQRQRHPAHRHPARQHERARRRRPDDGHRRHLLQLAGSPAGPHAGAPQGAPAWLAVQERPDQQPEQRAADLHHAADSEELGRTEQTHDYRIDSSNRLLRPTGPPPGRPAAAAPCARDARRHT